jgi:hypothetical protein
MCWDRIWPYLTQQILNKILCVEKNQRFLPNFCVLCPNLVLDFSKQVRFLRLTSKNIPETLKMPSLEKRPQGILRNYNTHGFFCFEFSFQNCFWNVFSSSGLSQICKIRNVWEPPSPFSRNTLISCSEKSSWNMMLEEKLSNKLKNSHDNFCGVKVFMVFGLLAWIS